MMDVTGCMNLMVQYAQHRLDYAHSIWQEHENSNDKLAKQTNPAAPDLSNEVAQELKKLMDLEGRESKKVNEEKSDDTQEEEQPQAEPEADTITANDFIPPVDESKLPDIAFRVENAELQSRGIIDKIWLPLSNSEYFDKTRVRDNFLGLTSRAAKAQFDTRWKNWKLASQEDTGEWDLSNFKKPPIENLKEIAYALEWETPDQQTQTVYIPKSQDFSTLTVKQQKTWKKKMKDQFIKSDNQQEFYETKWNEWKEKQTVKTSLPLNPYFVPFVAQDSFLIKLI